MKSPLPLAIKYAFAVLLIFPLLVLSQKQETFPGYYINLKGDTIRGSYPSYKQWRKNPAQVGFKPQARSSNIELTPVNCASFEITNNDTYFSYAGSRIRNPYEFSTLLNEHDSTTIYDTVSVFLRVVYDHDNYKLLILEDNQRINFFIQLPNQPITELSCKGYINEDHEFKSIETYKYQLQEYFHSEINAKSLQKNLASLKYDESKLKSFMEEVIGKKQSISENHTPLVNFFINGGVSFNQFKMTNNDGSKTVYPDSYSPYLRLGIELRGKRNFSKGFFSFQLSAFKFKNEVTITSASAVWDTITSTSEAKYILAPALFLGYNIIQNKNIKWQVACGGGLSFFIGHYDTEYKESQSLSGVFTRANSKTEQQPIRANVQLQTSLIIKKFQFMLDYTIPTTTSPYLYRAGKSTYIQAGVGLYF